MDYYTLYESIKGIHKDEPALILREGCHFPCLWDDKPDSVIIELNNNYGQYDLKAVFMDRDDALDYRAFLTRRNNDD